MNMLNILFRIHLEHGYNISKYFLDFRILKLTEFKYRFNIKVDINSMYSGDVILRNKIVTINIIDGRQDIETKAHILYQLNHYFQLYMETYYAEDLEYIKLLYNS